MSISEYVQRTRKIENSKNKYNLEYSAIYDYDELKGYYVRRMADLDYPLRLEAKYKRDRYILNQKGLEEVLEEACDYAFKKIEKEVQQLIEEEYFTLIQYEINNVINSLNITSLGANVTTPVKHHKITLADKLGKSLGKTFTDSVISYFNQFSHRKKKR